MTHISRTMQRQHTQTTLILSQTTRILRQLVNYSNKQPLTTRMLGGSKKDMELNAATCTDVPFPHAGCWF